MATRPDQLFALYAKRAQSPDVTRLFEQLADRAVTLARMQDEFLENILRNREARTGKPFRYTKRQRQYLDEAEKDAEQAVGEIERLAADMDDKNLLTAALSCEQQQLEMAETMAPTYAPEDREMAQRIIDYRRQTIRLIEQFVEASSFKGQIVTLP